MFLQTMRDVEDQVVVTPEIRAEWEQHWSRFFRTWLRSMYGRKQVATLEAPPDKAMRQRLGGLGLAERQVFEARKDAHLIEAARVADRVVCSFDVHACNCFRRLAVLVNWVGDIAWIDPERDAEELLSWLKSRRAWRRRLRHQT